MHKARQEGVVSHLRGRLSPRRRSRCVLCVHGGGLPQVLDVVEDLLVAAARPVPHVVQRAHLPLLHLHLHLLVQDLQEMRRARAAEEREQVCSVISHKTRVQHFKQGDW